MSVYIAFGEGDPAFVASNSGWGAFGRWVDGLDAAAYPDLVHLREYGWTEPVKDLHAQLKAAAEADPPPDADTRGVAADLLDLLDHDDPEAVVVLGNGIVAGDDPPPG